MVSISMKKADDLNKILDNLRKKGENKQCFDCLEKGTTYVVLNFGTFVCSNCAGIHREFNYKVKGLGVSNFTEKEISFLQENGNLVNYLVTKNAKNIWLGIFDIKKNKLPDPKNSTEVKNHIKSKYMDKKFYLKIEKVNPIKKKEEKEASDASSDEEPRVNLRQKNKEFEQKVNNREEDKNNSRKEKLSPIKCKGSMRGISETPKTIPEKNNIVDINNSGVNKRGSAEGDTISNVKSHILNQIVTSNQSKINNINWENIWGGTSSNNEKEDISNNKAISPLTNGSSVNKTKDAPIFNFDFIDNNSKSSAPKTNDNYLNNNMFNQFNKPNEITKNTNNSLGNNVQYNNNVFQQFDNISPNINNNFSQNSNKNNNVFNFNKKDDPLDKLLLESNFTLNNNNPNKPVINPMNNNLFMAQLSMNPMLMQQYYMVMQNPNINPQMYNYFLQMMNMQNIPKSNSFMPQVAMNIPTQIPNTFNNIQQSSLSPIRQQSNYSPNLQQRNSLQINTNYNNQVINPQNEFMLNNVNTNNNISSSDNAYIDTNKISIVDDIFNSGTPKTNNKNFNPFM